MPRDVSRMCRLHLPRERRIARETLYRAYLEWRDLDPEHISFPEELSVDIVYLPAKEMPGALGSFDLFGGLPPYLHRMKIREDMPYGADVHTRWHEMTHLALIGANTTATGVEFIDPVSSRHMEAMCDAFGTAMLFWQVAKVELLRRESLREFFTAGVEESGTVAELYRFQARRILELAQALQSPAREHIVEAGTYLLYPQDA